jgi:uncharacterized protein (UPF0276 family)
LDSINKIGGFIDQYKGSLEDNHILNEITSYDKVIKDYDRMFVDKDTKLFNEYAISKAHDDHLNDDELELLFSQQVRKIMSKNVREMEKVIKVNVKKGKMGEQSALVDYIMYISIAFVGVFGWMSYKKLKDQHDTLVI